MRKSKFTESQIVGMLKEAEAGVAVAEMNLRRELEAENAQLKRIYADLARENAAIKDVLVRKL